MPVRSEYSLPVSFILAPASFSQFSVCRVQNDGGLHFYVPPFQRAN